MKIIYTLELTFPVFGKIIQEQFTRKFKKGASREEVQKKVDKHYQKWRKKNLKGGAFIHNYKSSK